MSDRIPGVRLDGTEIAEHAKGTRRCPELVRQLAARHKVHVFGAEYDPAADLQNIDADLSARAIAAFDQHFGMMILGTVGVGKSYLASALLNRELQLNCNPATFATVPNLFRDFRKSELEFAAGDRDDSLRPAVEEVPLIVFDDLGAEKASEWTEALLYGIVAERYSRKLRMIITANCKLKDLRDKIGERTLDRLLGACGNRPLAMDGESRRRMAR